MPALKRSRVSFVVDGPIAPTDLPGLCRRVCALLERSGAALALCDVESVPADVVTVDALARLQLAAHRYGCQVRLRGASEELRELVAFMGLRDVLPG
jgi:ABC-type transporter Mla MlaB component